MPDSWVWCTCGEVCNFERGITFPASAKEPFKTPNNIACLRTANVQEEVDLSDLLYISRKFIINKPEKLIKDNDIIISTANSRELVGKTSFVHCVSDSMTFGGFIGVVRANNIDSKYLFYFLRHCFITKQFASQSTQTTNIANITSATIDNLRIPIPPLNEQRRIVDMIVTVYNVFNNIEESLS